MTKKQSVDELTGLRGIAALLILFNHLQLLYPAIFRQSDYSHILSYCGMLGMDLFFILSGFVIYYNYADTVRTAPRDGIIKFLIARFARLYPLYFLFIVWFFIYNIFKDEPQTICANIATLPAFLTGVQSWLYTFIGELPIVHLQGSSNISWSISTEAGLYLFFIPLVLFVYKARSLKSAIFILLLAVAGCILWPILVHSSSLIAAIFGSLTPASTYYSYTEYLTFHCPMGTRVYEFLAGCAIAQIYLNTHDKVNKNLFKLISGLLLAGLTATVITCSSPGLLPTIVLCVLLVLLIGSFTLGGCNFLKSKPLLFMGEISYSTYLLHIIFICFFGQNGHSMTSTILNIALFFICTYVAAYYSYKFIEMPARKKVKHALTNLFNFNDKKTINEKESC